MTVQATNFESIGSSFVCESKIFINSGAKNTLRKGQSVTFTNLPSHPIAIVGHNNNGCSTHVLLNAANRSSCEKQTINIAETQTFSVGCAYIINPEKMQINEMTLSLPDNAPDQASVDIQIVSLCIPDNKTQAGTVFLDGNPISFHSCSNEPMFKQLFSF